LQNVYLYIKWIYNLVTNKLIRINIFDVKNQNFFSQKIKSVSGIESRLKLETMRKEMKQYIISSMLWDIMK